jgi:hypothetical protein
VVITLHERVDSLILLLQVQVQVLALLLAFFEVLEKGGHAPVQVLQSGTLPFPRGRRSKALGVVGKRGKGAPVRAERDFVNLAGVVSPKTVRLGVLVHVPLNGEVVIECLSVLLAAGALFAVAASAERAQFLIKPLDLLSVVEIY